MGCLKSFFSFHKVSEKEQKTTVILLWDNKRIHVNFKEFPGGFNEATVKDLKEKCKALTDVPIALMKLQISGANMKDDAATLTSLGVRTNSIITLNGEKADEVVVKQTASGNPEEYGLMLRIEKIVVGLSEGIIEQITEFENMITDHTSKNKKLDDIEKKKLQDRGIYLSERIMQGLIGLDGVECPSGFETARQRRREGVRLSQQLLDRVDKSRAIVKELCKK
ncbi:uncharacterized protein BX663DRAFT_520314 [Cokeromyces recurvatus]|uniref:uncharacterized protein n=1 Tax=Cokeromyces recurvatus TaxID=90255 RepID=UPI002220A6C7|nr:uncharacterized protein BX663DRAFT_520314 [Cokeromyces recurvatus]KAI7899753.1 hypothetical protein BX663DRAFT_520314 [Cokeromyces recurvatus]